MNGSRGIFAGRLAALAVLAAVSSSLAALPVVTITEAGRRIQLDGFLLEWSEATARTFNGDGRIIWNAVNTVEGFTGFIKNTTSDSCRMVSLRIGGLQRPPYTLRLDSSAIKPGQADIYAVAHDTAALYSAEFVIPWNEMVKQGNKTYQVELTAFSACGDSAGIVCRGDIILPPATSVITPKIKFQIFVIAVLLGAFVLLQYSVRKKKPRTGLPRR